MTLARAGLLWVVIIANVSVGQSGLTVDQIAERHIAALGGRDKLDAIHAITKRLTYREGSFVIPDAFVALMRPYYKTIGDPKNLKAEVNEGYDGSAWEYYADPGVVLRTVGAAAAATRHGTEMFDSLVDYKLKHTQIEVAGDEGFDGKPCYRLHVTLADGFEKELFVDKASFLIIGDRRAAPVHAFGEAVRSENRIGDYRRVGGVLFPHSLREVEIATGRELSSETIELITINPKLEPAFFGPPQFERTPLQQFLEQLYMERTDPVSVMWTYHTFRTANPRLNAREGVEFIGYQMVKMGDFKAALELLSSNAEDYPRAASAWFGLGRAYTAAGDAANARRSFQRALEIDPDFKKATDGLNALR